MADISWNDVLKHAAELGCVDVVVRTQLLDYVNSVIQVALIDGEDGPKTKLVRIYLAAHFGKLTTLSTAGTAGAILSKKEGDVAVTYANTSVLASAPQGSTTYGQIYLTLIGTSAIRAPLLT